MKTILHVGLGALVCLAGLVAAAQPARAGVICGNGSINPGEDCDGTDFGGETCLSLGFAGGALGCTAMCLFDTSSCTVAPICGDGTVDAGEDCDDGASNSDTTPDACRTDCTNAGCGDGTIDTGEDCDDGNTTAGDGCDATCQTEPAPACGDGTVDAGEECDDGNTTAGDGCDATCMLEAVCGNDVVEDGEECEPPGTEICDASCNIVPARGCNCTCGVAQSGPPPIWLLGAIIGVVALWRRRNR